MSNIRTSRETSKEIRKLIRDEHIATTFIVSTITEALARDKINQFLANELINELIERETKL